MSPTQFVCTRLWGPASVFSLSWKRHNVCAPSENPTFSSGAPFCVSVVLSAVFLSAFFNCIAAGQRTAVHMELGADSFNRYFGRMGTGGGYLLGGYFTTKFIHQDRQTLRGASTQHRRDWTVQNLLGILPRQGSPPDCMHPILPVLRLLLRLDQRKPVHEDRGLL